MPAGSCYTATKASRMCAASQGTHSGTGLEILWKLQVVYKQHVPFASLRLVGCVADSPCRYGRLGQLWWYAGLLPTFLDHILHAAQAVRLHHEASTHWSVLTLAPFEMLQYHTATFICGIQVGNSCHAFRLCGRTPHDMSQAWEED